ncbi:MAG: DUF1353 domain-containing protein [Granulosicoccus sp.]|nr:DUF1353 domain-containing protein [Granulosicoccus sp.]
MNTMNEEFTGSIEVEFEGMPSIRLESYKPAYQASTLQRLAIATRRRRFSLRENWEIELDDVDYSGELNGTVQIPAKHSDEQSIVFDGASIPFPWLISLLTVGVLRPLGVILVGSIVHDYAYQYGYLRISRHGGEFEEVALSRHRADRLFRDIVGTVNRLPAVGYIAWFAVRIGWLWVKYNGKHFGGKVPVFEYAILLLSLISLVYLYSVFGLMTLAACAIGVYFFLYLVSIVVNQTIRR